jgi:hypothetical protein
MPDTNPNTEQEHAKPEAQLVHAQHGATPEMRKPNEAESKMHLALLNIAAVTFAPWRQEMLDAGAAPNSDTMLAGAMASYAGAIIGELVGMGVIAPSAVDSVLDGMRKNMASGIEAGRRKMVRATEQFMAEEAARQGQSGVAS